MATKNIVPNDNGEGGIGVTAKRWSTAFINTVTGNVTGNLTGQVLTAAQTNINSILATDLIIGEDAQTAIDFGTVNEIDFKVDNANRLTLTSSVLAPATTNQIDLGTSSLEFKDAFFDGTVTADAFAGPLTGNVTGNVSGTAATVTGAAQSNITSLGTLTGLTLSGNIILPQTGVVAFNSTSDEYIQGAADQLFFGTGNLARLTLDNSNATFTGNIKIPNNGTIGSAGTAGALTIASGGDATFSGDVILSQSGGLSSDIKGDRTDAQLTIKGGSAGAGVQLFGNTFTNFAGALFLDATASTTGTHDASIVMRTGSSPTTALTIDRSQNATFAGDIELAGKIRADGASSQGQVIIATSKALGSLVAGNTIGEVVFQHDLTGPDGAVIAAVADENTAAGEDHHGARLEFYTAANGDNTSNPVKRTTIGNDGVLTQNGALRLGTGTNAANAVSDDFIIDPGVSSVGMTIFSSGQGTINFADGDGDANAQTVGGITYTHSDNTLIFTAGNTNTANVKATGVSITGTTEITGNAGIGTTTQTGVRLIVDAPEHAFKAVSNSTGFASIIADNTGSSGTRFFQSFRISNTEVGKITSTGSATVYATTSDYRLKENLEYTWDAITRLKQLKPVRFNFIADETNTLVDGFLAHEVENIVPEAISGEKDAVDSEGNPNYQGIDQSKIVPLLTKAMQEQQVIIEDLKSRIETLEG